MAELLDASGKPISGSGGATADPSKDSPSNSPSSGSTDTDSRYARADDVAKLADRFSQVTDTLTRLEGYVQGASSAAPPPAAAPSGPVVTEEDINRALEEGKNPAAHIRALVDQAVNKTAAAAAERIRSLEEYGSSNFEAFAEAQAKNWPKFERYEREIRGEINKLAPNLKGDPRAWKYAYEIVLGRHATELANEAAEEALRRADAERPNPSIPVNTEPPKMKDGTPVPTPKDLGGEEAVAALRYRGIDQEQYARTMGYESWADYTEVANLKDPYEDEKFLFPLGKSRGPSFSRRARI